MKVNITSPAAPQLCHYYSVGRHYWDVTITHWGILGDWLVLSCHKSVTNVTKILLFVTEFKVCILTVLCISRELVELGDKWYT